MKSSVEENPVAFVYLFIGIGPSFKL